MLPTTAVAAVKRRREEAWGVDCGSVESLTGLPGFSDANGPDAKLNRSAPGGPR